MSLSKSYHFPDRVDMPAQGVLITQQAAALPARSISVNRREKEQGESQMEKDIQLYIKQLNLVIK